MHISQLTGGAHSRAEACIASPTSPPYVGKQLTALFHTQPPLTSRFYSIAAQTVNCIFQLKPSPVLQALGHCHQLGLAYGRKTWAYPMNTLFATVAFLLLLDTNLLPQTGITHYSQLPTLQHSTKLLCFFCLFFLSRSKLIFKAPTTTWGSLPICLSLFHPKSLIIQTERLKIQFCRLLMYSLAIINT